MQKPVDQITGHALIRGETGTRRCVMFRGRDHAADWMQGARVGWMMHPVGGDLLLARI